MEEKNDINKSPIGKIAAFIVDKRMLFFLIYIIAIIFSMFSQNWVKVDNELSDYLESSTETREGLTLMDDQFTTFGTAKIMVANITYRDAQTLYDKIEDMSGVSTVTFTSNKDDQTDFQKHYNNGSALYEVTFSYDEDDDRALEALNNLESKLSDYDIYVSTSMGDTQSGILATEMQRITVLVAIVVFVVLLLTSESYGEIPVLALTFIVSMILNAGTNFLFGTISYISNSVSSILQLALSVDYAIMFCNRFKEERRNGYDVRDAVIVSLSKAIPEILSSSLTTISGLFALIFMQYRIGADMGIVLIKAILLSLLTVFTLMPGLLMIFSGLMEKTGHKSFIPKISVVGKFDYMTRKIIPAVFIVVFIGAAVLSQKCPYVYGYSTLSTLIKNETQIASDMIDDNFGKTNYVALVVPGNDFDKEKKLIDDLEARDEVDHCTGLANTVAMDDYTLTDKLNPREFSELMDMEYEVIETLYTAYAASHDDYGRIVGGISSYKVSLMDMLMYVHDVADDGYVTLDDSTQKTLDDAYVQISDGRKQLEGKDYDRILVYLNLPEESTETFNFLTQMHTICADYYDGEVYVVGDSTSERDLKDSFETDNVVVSVISILFVLVILLFTFKSAGMPVLLILVIEGAIFINFSFPYLMNQNLFFMGYLIVSSIQMGANIDYAIVISSRYMELRKTQERRDAVINALNFAFPTIITSGSMMILAGVFIAMMTSDPCIMGIGECLGRGTFISIVLVMFVLPQILLIGDKLIAKTAFDIARPVRAQSESGTVVVNGTIRGTVNGTVVGSMNAVVHGSVNAVIISGNMVNTEGGGQIEDRSAHSEKDSEGSGGGSGSDDVQDGSKSAGSGNDSVEDSDGIKDCDNASGNEKGGDGNEINK